jgi:hypothetical protein
MSGEERRSVQRSESERKVEETDALLQETVGRLSRNCLPHLLCEAAREELLELTPHLLEALDALADLEVRRGLSDEEYARRREFSSLLQLAGGDLPQERPSAFH